MSIVDLSSSIQTEINLSTDQINVVPVGPRLLFQVKSRHVQEGTKIEVSSTSDPALVEILGFNEADYDLATGKVISDGMEFPISITVPSQLRMTLSHESDPAQTFTWNLPVGAYATPLDFVNQHGSDLADALIEINAEGELEFTLTPNSAEPIEEIEASTTGLVSIDQFGLDKSLSSEGLITLAARNTVRGDRREIIGQAIAAYYLQELTQPWGGAGADPVPNIPFAIENDENIYRAFANRFDDFHGIAVYFLDADKRGAATGGYITSRIQDGDYVFEYTNFADGQIVDLVSDAAVVAHEVGHNIGFPDLYNNSPGNYDPELNFPDDWEMMAFHFEMPHPGAWVKSEDSDWVVEDGGRIEVFDLPPAADPPISETNRYLLTPLEYSKADYDDLLVNIPAGLQPTKVVKLPIGRGEAGNNHSLLIQNRQNGANFSQSLPSPGRGIYVSDTITRRLFNYFLTPTRNFVHPLRGEPLQNHPITNHPNIVGVENSAGVELDLSLTYPAYGGTSVNIIDEITDANGIKSYVIDVTRTNDKYLDLAITPWGAPPWESADIWIENGDKEEDELSAVPLALNGEPARWAEDYDQGANDGKPLNWVRVRIHNYGNVDATNVQIQVKANTPSGMGDSGDWSTLPLSELKNIPAGGHADFKVPWNPSVGRHTCLKVQIFRWDASEGEVNFANNQTQENVNSFAVRSGSPWHPRTIEFDVSNPFERVLPVQLSANNLPVGVVVDFDNPYFELEPKSTSRQRAIVRVDSERFPWPEPDGHGGLDWFRAVLDDDGNVVGKTRGKPVRFHFDISSEALTDGHAWMPIGGISYDTRLTRTSEVDYDVKPDGAGGFIVDGTTEPAAANQDLEIMVRYPSGKIDWIKTRTAGDGHFSVGVQADEEGTAEVEVRPVDKGQFSFLDPGAKRIDPSQPVVEGKDCPICLLPLWFWLLLFAMVLLTLLMLIWLIRRKAKC